MHPTILHIATADDVDAETPAVGWYVRDGREIHGEFQTKKEAEEFIDYLAGEVRKERRHVRSLGAGI